MFKKIFLHCSGVDMHIIEGCSNAEQNKYIGIGATVFFTAVMATIAASFALYTIFETLPSAIFFGIIWGLLIFNLDRFIVSTIRKRGNNMNELIQATPRIILAIIIAVVISKPLELKLFEKEINQVLLTRKHELTQANQDQIGLRFAPEITALEIEKQALEDIITSKEAEVNTLYALYIAEAEGRDGTLKLGKGPVYKEKREKHDASLVDLKTLKTKNNTKITEIDNQIAALKKAYKLEVKNAQPIIDNADGLMARVNALAALPWLPSFFIFLLFLAIETSPIFSKLLSSRGEYDLKYEDAEQTIAVWAKQKSQQRKALLATDIKLNNKVYDAIAEEDTLYAYKKSMARELMQKQASMFYKRQEQKLF
jgi:hypothetical protein